MERVMTLSSDKFKEKWENSTKFSFERDGTSGYSWSQRNYTCSFCKKEFRSAQALGGHMNVHRRDRAKLKLSPSCNDFPNSNPNPSFSSSTPARFLPYTTHHSSLTPSFSSQSSASTDEEKMLLKPHSWREPPVSPQSIDFMKKMIVGPPFCGVKELKGFAGDDHEIRVLKKREIVLLDLNMGLLRDAKEDLDLELRLGYTH